MSSGARSGWHIDPQPIAVMLATVVALLILTRASLATAVVVTIMLTWPVATWRRATRHSHTRATGLGCAHYDEG